MIAQPTLACLLIAALAPGLMADEVRLSDGGSLTGKVLSIGPDGKVSVELPIADQPIDLRADHVRRVKFNPVNLDGYEHDARLTLINGDTLPCDLVAVDEQALRVSTSYAGTLTIPRKAITTAQLGIRPHRLLYKGPESLEGWKMDDNWHYEDGALVSDGRGSISHAVEDLPESFSLSFNLAWNRIPNMQIYFCSPDSTGVGVKSDRYYLQFNIAGIGIKRQSSSGKSQFKNLATVNRPPDTYKDRQVDIEIRVDHAQRLVLLYINGELEGRYPDLIPDPPTGNTVIFQSNTSDEEAHRISNVQFREWDPAGERHKSEDRGDSKGDSLIDNEGQRFAGSLLGSKGEGEALTVLFKSPHVPDALEIPAASISTLFFRDMDGEVPAKPPLLLGLTNSGSLGAEDCTFNDQEVQLTHSVLGPLKISRQAVKLLDRREVAEEEDEEPETDTEE